MNRDAIVAQSKAAYGQWKDQWAEHATAHAAFPQKSLSDFELSGIGKAVVLVGNGASFERQIDVIKRYQHNVDVVACDKTLGHLLNHGIVPKYVILCDANVSYEKYLEPWKDQLDRTILFSNVCGNPKWTHAKNQHGKTIWKDIYFFVNMDVLGTEKEFGKLSGCPNVIPAATNVSNAMVVFMTQSDDSGRKNFFGYDKIILVGYDYSWLVDGSYYAFEKDGGGKHHYMRHVTTLNEEGQLCFTSNNLAFSAEWLSTYCKAFHLPVVQCSQGGMLPLMFNGKLEEQMRYKPPVQDADRIRRSASKYKELLNESARLREFLANAATEHYHRFRASI